MSFEWRAIRAIMRKDLLHVLQNKSVLVPTVLVPTIILVILPAVLLSIPRWVSIEEMSADDIEPILRMVSSAGIEPQALTDLESWVVGSASYLLAPMFLIVPLMISSILAADSFVGEKERHTLEGLLYTPTSTRDLFAGKLLAAFVPAMVVEIVSFAAYTIVVNAAGYYAMGRLFFPSLIWWPLVFWMGPGVSLSGLGLTVLISSKAQTFVQAQQWSGVLVLPLVFLMVGQVAGFVSLGIGVVLLAGAFFWAIGIAATWYGARTFSRAELIAQV